MNKVCEDKGIMKKGKTGKLFRNKENGCLSVDQVWEKISSQ